MSGTTVKLIPWLLATSTLDRPCIHGQLHHEEPNASHRHKTCPSDIEGNEREPLRYFHSTQEDGSLDLLAGTAKSPSNRYSQDPRQCGLAHSHHNKLYEIVLVSELLKFVDHNRDPRLRTQKLR
jgi:hypothetical protein